MDGTDSPDVCGVGIRGVAIAIDSVAWFALLFVAVYAVALPTGQVDVTATGVDAQLTGTYGTASFLLWLGLGTAYHALLEWRFGRTVGKYLVQIRVTGGDGSPPSLRAALVRNLVRLVDWFPLFYVVGVLAMVVSDRDRRLGDRVGDTLVVR
jgi:uncharacterized RDD family membrane protein YckC